MSEAVQVRLEPAELSVAARYEALIRLSQAVSGYREPKKLFDALVDELRCVIEFDGIGIAQYDETTNTIEWHVSIHCDEPSLAPPKDCAQKETKTLSGVQNPRP